MSSLAAADRKRRNRRSRARRGYPTTPPEQNLLPSSMTTSLPPSGVIHPHIGSNEDLFESLDAFSSRYKPPTGLGDKTDDTQLLQQDFLEPTAMPRAVRFPPQKLEINRNPAPDLAWSVCSHGCCCIQCVRTQEIGFQENCGRFEHLLSPGLYVLPYPFQTVAGRVTLRMQQLDVTCETITSDQVICLLSVSLLYRIAPVHSYQAYYNNANPRQQIESNLVDVIRATVPSYMTIEALFLHKEILIDTIWERLHAVLYEWGYEICGCLITHVSPEYSIRSAMNELNASQRFKVAAAYKAEAEKSQRILQAQGQAEASALSGTGTRKEREQIVLGLKESVQQWTQVDVRVPNPPSAASVMELLLFTQYVDLLSHLKPDLFQIHHSAVPEVLMR